MNLSPRLKSIVGLLDLPARVADIGTDHGYLPIYIAKKSQSKGIIASDYNIGPYKSALENVQSLGLLDRISVRLGSGLSVLKVGEVQQVVIAGMGSKTIKAILEDDYRLALTLERLVLQPMAGASSLRKWLVNNGFEIFDEELVLEGNLLYQIIVAKPGKMEVKDELILELGPKLLEKEDELLELYFERLRVEWRAVIEKISINAPDHHKIDEIENKLKKLEALKNKFGF